MDITNSINYIKLSKFLFKPTLIFLGVIFLLSLAQIVSLYFVYIPKYIVFFHDHLNEENLSILNDAMNKIVINISVWVFILLILNIVLINFLQSAKKLIKDIDEIKN